jgi:predicted nucleotidyltransferase
MTRERQTRANAQPARWYRGADIPMRVIRRFARQVAERFRPDKIILFGSYAYGTPHQDSDVDILVVMPCRNQLDQAVKIELACDPPFPLDIIVRKPHNLRWRLEEGESFHTEIVTRGKVLYEKKHARVGAKGRKRLPTRDRHRSGDPGNCWNTRSGRGVPKQ